MSQKALTRQAGLLHTWQHLPQAPSRCVDNPVRLPPKECYHVGLSSPSCRCQTYCTWRSALIQAPASSCRHYLAVCVHVPDFAMLCIPLMQDFMHKPNRHHGHYGAEHVGFAGEEESLPDHSPTGSQKGHEMDVSSGSEAEAVPAQHKKKHLTEDEMEAVLAAKGASKAREWLDSDFGGFKKVRRALCRLSWCTHFVHYTDWHTWNASDQQAPSPDNMQGSSGIACWQMLCFDSRSGATHSCGFWV